MVVIAKRRNVARIIVTLYWGKRKSKRKKKENLASMIKPQGKRNEIKDTKIYV